MKKTVLFLLILLVTISCSKDKNKEESHAMTKLYSLASNDNMPPPPPPSSPFDISEQTKLIKTGELSIKSNDIEFTKNQLRRILFQCKGNIKYESFSNSDQQSRYNFLFDVPALNFDRFISKLDSLKLDIQQKEYRVIDVTLSYIDDTSRLRNKKKLEQIYIDLLAKAKTVEDIIEIQKKIEEIRAEIESKEEQLKALDHKIALSEFSIILETPIKEIKNKKDATSDNRAKFSKAFAKGISGIIDTLAFLLSIWPIYLIVGMLYVLFLILRNRRRNKKRNKTGES